MSNSTITLQNRLNWASTHGDLLPLAGVGGYTDEPGLTICNDALSDLISDPNDWKFNRVEMPMLVSCPNKQDQLFAGACIFTLAFTGANPSTGWVSQGWGIDLASNSAITVSGGFVTITTLEPHRIPVGALVYMTGNVAGTGSAANASVYNSTFTDNATNSSWSGGWTVTAIGAKTVTFAAVSGQSNGDILGAPGIANYGYLTSATFQELNNTSSPPNLQPCTAYRELPKVSLVGNPDKISVLADLGTGVLKIRYHTVPSSVVWGAHMVYQAKAPLKTALANTWAPFPDNFQAVINQALLYRMYRYLNDPKADNEFKKLQAAIAKAQGTDMAETTDVSLQPESLMMDGYYNSFF
jgi:hypothetical protein